MNFENRNDELLREASAYGDEEGVKALIDVVADINSQHSVNGWTALHWASKRGHTSIVRLLLSRGADPMILSVYGESAFSLAGNEEIRNILSSRSTDSSLEFRNTSPLPITPNYLANPTLCEKVVEKQDSSNSEVSYYRNISSKYLKQNMEELVLKVRTSDPPNQDFIEIEIPLKNLSYENVFQICCNELEVAPKNVMKLRKLPNTIVRKDKDVLRFQNFEELELVINSSNSAAVSHTVKAAVQEANGYVNNNRQSSNSVLINKSNYCKNGRILY